MYRRVVAIDYCITVSRECVLEDDDLWVFSFMRLSVAEFPGALFAVKY